MSFKTFHVLKEHNTVLNSLCSYGHLERVYKILLIEDEIAFQCLHEAALKKMGYDLDLAENGERAIEQFQQTSYDLILLDIGLPDISGIDVVRFIRAHPNGKQIPIVALTGYGKIVEAECLAVGVDEVLPKPIKIDQLQSVVKDKLVERLNHC